MESQAAVAALNTRKLPDPATEDLQWPYLSKACKLHERRYMGSAGFEPAASSAQGWHHTKLDNDPCEKLVCLSAILTLVDKLEAVLPCSVELANYRDRVATVLAAVVAVKVPFVDAKAVAPDDHALALGAVRVLHWVAWHVSKVRVL